MHFLCPLFLFHSCFLFFPFFYFLFASPVLIFYVCPSRSHSFCLFRQCSNILFIPPILQHSVYSTHAPTFCYYHKHWGKFLTIIYWGPLRLEFTCLWPYTTSTLCCYLQAVAILRLGRLDRDRFVNRGRPWMVEFVRKSSWVQPRTGTYVTGTDVAMVTVWRRPRVLRSTSW